MKETKEVSLLELIKNPYILNQYTKILIQVVDEKIKREKINH